MSRYKSSLQRRISIFLAALLAALIFTGCIPKEVHTDISGIDALQVSYAHDAQRLAQADTEFLAALSPQEAESLTSSKKSFEASGYTTRIIPAATDMETKVSVDESYYVEMAIPGEAFPEPAVMYANTCKWGALNNEASALLQEEGLTEGSTLTILDIGFESVNGGDSEPASPMLMDISFGAVPLDSAHSINVYHVDESGDKPKLELVASTNPDNLTIRPASEGAGKIIVEDGIARASIEATSFSKYIISYTVDFYFGNYAFHLTGGTNMLMSELFTALGIEKSVKEITNVSFNAPAGLLDFSKSDDGEDWTIRSMSSFTEWYKLIISFNDGTIYTVDVTDAVGDVISHVISSNSTFTIPTGVKSIKATLIGGGTGGTGGYNGEAGQARVSAITTSKTMTSGELYEVGKNIYRNGGNGGSYGEGGAGGKIKTVTINTSGVSSLSIVIGEGGAGGASNGGVGTAGGATTVSTGTTTYSSEDGRVNRVGYYCEQTSTTYGMSGEDGYAGAAGGRGAAITSFSGSVSEGTNGGNVGSATGGRWAGAYLSGTDCYTFSRYSDEYNGVTVKRMFVDGGGCGGGGAAYNTNGNDGTKAKGGDGASPAAPARPEEFGTGGSGGNGGGGGGGAGPAYSGVQVSGGSYSYRGDWNTGNSSEGSGGIGSEGGPGASGCVILEYEENPADETPPTASVSGNPTTWTNSDVTLSINANDDVALHATPYSWDGGSTWTSASAKTFSQNQTVNIVVRDAAGNTVSRSVTISYIDKDAPTISSVGGGATSYSSSRRIDVAASDSTSYIAQYSFDGGVTWQNSPSKTISATTTVASIKVKDAAGNISAEFLVDVYVDATPPSVTYSVSPADVSKAVTSRTVTLTGIDSHSGVAQIGGYSFDGGTTWQNSNVRTITETTDILSVRVKDKVGNISDAVPITVNVDTSAPTFTIAGESTTFAKTRTITISAYDVGGAALHSAAYSFDGGDTWQTSNSHTYSGKTMTEQTVMVRDALGNKSSKTAAVYIDNTAPSIVSVSIDPPDASSASYKPKRTVTILAEDSNSGLSHAAGSYSFDGGSHWQVNNSKVISTTAETVSIAVRDKVGNVSQIQPVDVYVDADAPTFTANTDGTVNWTKASKTVTIDAYDAKSGLADNPYCFDGTNWQPGQEYTYYAPEGSIITTKTARVMDAAGNISTRSINVYADASKPTVSDNGSTTWVKGGEGNGKRITLSAGDTGSGIPATGAYCFDGVNWQDEPSFLFTQTAQTATVKVRDAVGNVREKEVNVYVDNDSPVIEAVYLSITPDESSATLAVYAKDNVSPEDKLEYCLNYDITNPTSAVWSHTTQSTFRCGVRVTIACKDELGNIGILDFTPSKTDMLKRNNGSTGGGTYKPSLISSSILDIEGYQLGKVNYSKSDGTVHSYETHSVNGTSISCLPVKVEAYPDGSGYLYGYAQLATGQRYPIYWDANATVAVTSEGGTGYVYINPADLTTSKSSTKITVVVGQYSDAELKHRTYSDQLTAPISIDVTPPVAAISYNRVTDQITVVATDPISGVAGIRYAIEHSNGAVDEFGAYTGPFAKPSTCQRVIVEATDALGNKSLTTSANLITGASGSEGIDVTIEAYANAYYYRSAMFNYYLIGSSK